MKNQCQLPLHCEGVVGIDFSSRFVEAANTLRSSGRLAYLRTDEGRVFAQCEAVVPSEIERERVCFEVGDACHLRSNLGDFDVAILINLVDRLPEPQRCLDRLPHLLRSGGQLIVASPFTWLEEYTPVMNWLGGFYAPDGRPISSFETLRERLDDNFEFVRSVELPFLIREHARKFQWSVSLAGIWRRR